jgi:NADPH:quinone reductase-like Zn-dependent oxidoreductase
MLAATIRRYGPPEVVAIEEMPDPVPGPGELLVRVSAAPVTAGDARIRALDMPPGFALLARPIFGLRRPRHPVFGWSFAGRVAGFGPGAAGFAEGGRVMGITGARGGAHAELLVIPAAGRVLPVPESLTDTEAAAFFFGGLTAADFLIDKAALRPGERLLVNGATGAVGTAALEIARHLGAEVTAVCRAANADLARRLGAVRVIDYRSEPVTGIYDVVMDVIGTLPWRRARPLLGPGGRLLPVTAGLGAMIGAALRPHRDGRRITGGVSAETPEAMRRLVALHAAGGYRPVVGATFPLARIAEAHALAGTRHKQGAAVVTMDADAAASLGPGRGA